MYQFGQYAWTHMILLVILMQSSFFVANIFDGLWWFLMPTLLVILNDIMAYVSGFFFGRTPLTSLSPKKTWEGFIGAFFCTMIGGFFLARFLAQYKWMTCPRTDLSVGRLDCDVASVYIPERYNIEDVISGFPEPLTNFILKASPFEYLMIADIQFHALVLSAFASIIAPFGGFFASGFKRAFKIKDFGDSIPGHGGLTDRMDCQIVIASFANIYYNTMVKTSLATVAGIVQTVESLPSEMRLEVFIALGNMLVGDGILKDSDLPNVPKLARP